jgi:hypothetical protein
MGNLSVGNCISLSIPKSHRQVQYGTLTGIEIRIVLYKDLG